MVDGRLIAFLGVSALLVITPGPDMAMVTKNALRPGRRGALLTTLGIVSAILVHTTAAAFGLAVLLRTEASVFTAIKLCGAAYLLYLGVQALWSSVRSGEQEMETSRETEGAPRARSGLAAYRQGLLSALLNPKLLVFFATFLPQFVEPGRPALPQMLVLGLLFDLLGLIWLTSYGLFVTRMRDVFRSPRVRRRMERVTGVVLVGLAGRLALDRL
jgi:threonine/homoserine/homoserine lactone efflux protein